MLAGLSSSAFTSWMQFYKIKAERQAKAQADAQAESEGE